MGEAKIELALGAVSFSGEGDQEWLGQQLDKILKAAPELARIAPAVQARSAPPAAVQGKFTETLASYLKRQGGEDNQVKRFLAAADWLRLHGMTKPTTAAVTKALKENQQKRLGNPADCLNQNVSKGYCEKAGGGFFITPDGLKALAHTA